MCVPAPPPRSFNQTWQPIELFTTLVLCLHLFPWSLFLGLKTDAHAVRGPQAQIPFLWDAGWSGGEGPGRGDALEAEVLPGGLTYLSTWH